MTDFKRWFAARARNPDRITLEEAYQAGMQAKIEQMERQEPVAWKYEIAAYADHRTDVGVVLNKRELSSAVPAEQITWTPLFAFDGRQTPEASRTAIEMIDRLEAAEEEIESWKGLAQQFGNEADALRAAVRHEADCVEAAKAEIEALRAKITAPCSATDCLPELERFAAIVTAAHESRFKWYFKQVEPSGTVVARTPDGNEFVVKGGNFDTGAGRELLNAMIAAMSGP